MRPLMTGWIFELMVILFCCATVRASGSEFSGNDPKKMQQTAAAHLSVIALGPVPARKYKMPDESDLERAREQGDGKKDSDPGAQDIPILLPPRPGSVPYSVLHYRASAAKRRSSQWAQVHVGYNNDAPVSIVPAGVRLDLHCLDVDQQDVYRSYLKLPALAAWSQSIALLTPSKGGPIPWRAAPKMRMINIQSPQLANKNVLLLNDSKERVVCSLSGNAWVTLEPGQSQAFAVGQGRGLFGLKAVKAHGRVPLLNTNLRRSVNALSLVAFYPAYKKTNGGRDVGVFITTVMRCTPEELRQRGVVVEANGKNER